MRIRRTTATTFAAVAATLLVACGQGPSPEELATDACNELPAGVPQPQVEEQIQSLAEEQGVDLGEEDLQQALREVEDRCPEVLEEPEEPEGLNGQEEPEEPEEPETEDEQETQDDLETQDDQETQDGQEEPDEQEDEGEE